MSNKSLEYPNSTPSQTGDVLEELSKITGIPVRSSNSSRGANEGAPVVARRRSTLTMDHWQCAVCSADNSEAVGNRCGACGTRSARLEKRDSIASKSSSSLNSYTIDELVGNLEGLEFDVNVDTYSTTASLPASSLTESMGESSVSRFSQGNWSLRDLEKWSCSMCTYENEPLFCACEMCGTTRPLPKAARSEGPQPEAETIRAQQEQRLSELLQFRRPVAASATSTPNEATISSVSSSLPPLSSTLAKLSISATKPGRTSNRGKMGMSSRQNARRPQGNIPPMGGMDASMSTHEFSADVSKPHMRRGYNPDDSTATATTFDMSSSMAMADDSWFAATSDQQQHVAIYPGIAEEDAASC